MLFHLAPYALSLSIVGIFVATVGAARQGLIRLTRVRRLNKRRATVHGLRAIMADLIVLDRRIHYRHNIHCPACGRFSCKMPDGVGGILCHQHGWILDMDKSAPITVTVEIMPIIAVIDDEKHELEVLDGGTLDIPAIEITAEMVLAYDPVTEPIDIIPSLKELEPA